MLQEGESGGVAVHRALMAAGPGVATAVAALVLSHGISFVRRGTGFALVMVLLKLLADAASHLVEHRWLAGRPVRA